MATWLQAFIGPKGKPDEWVPPPALDDHHSFVMPDYGNRPYTDKNQKDGELHGYPWPGVQENTWAGDMGKSVPGYTFFDVPQQDRILVHFDRPPGDGNAKDHDAWWQDRNEAFLQRGQFETLQSGFIPEVKSRVNSELNPYLDGVPETRVTQLVSPSSYRFTRPFDQSVPKIANNLGAHFSMAAAHRTYEIGGQTVAPQWRNTYRLPPTTRDEMMYDVSPNYVEPTPAAVMVSPSPAPRNGAYRLG